MNQIVGDRIRRLRGEKSQPSFAAESEISLRSLQNYESGARIPPGPVLARMAEQCGVSVDWILTGQEAGADRVAQPETVYSKSGVKEIVMMLEDMDKKEVEDVHRFIQEKKQAAAYRREQKLKEG